MWKSVNTSGAVRSTALALVAISAAVALVTVISVSGSPGDPARPVSPDYPYGELSESEGLAVAIDAAAFSGLATLLSVRLIPGERDHEIIGARVPEEAFTSESLVPLSAPGGVPLAVAWAGVPWRMSPVQVSGDIIVAFKAIDLTIRDVGLVRVTGDWKFQLAPPNDLAARLRVESLDAGPRAESHGIAVSVTGAHRSSLETVVSVSVESAVPVMAVGQPHVRFGDHVLPGSVQSTGDGGTQLLLVFPPTPFGEGIRVELPSFVRQPTVGDGAVRLNLGGAMARQGLTGEPGESGAVDELADISVVSGVVPPRIDSFEFSTAVLSGDETLTVGVTLRGNYDGVELVRAFAGESELRIDLLESSYRKDATGTIGSGTTRAYFQLPDGVPDSIVLTTGAPGELLHGGWAMELAPAR